MPDYIEGDIIVGEPDPWSALWPESLAAYLRACLDRLG